MSDPGSSGALSMALRDAARFDRRMVSIRSGLLAAVPVVAVLGGGVAGGDPVAGVSMGAGAMLVGIAWRTTGGRPPLALMATDATVMALATFVGSVTGSITWLHLIVVCLWSLMAGLLIGAGNRGGVIGTQSIIAVVVFGRFAEPAPAALGLAGLVLAGGLAQVVFLTLVRWPTPLRGQRQATAAAYRQLAALATSLTETSTLTAAASLDEAEASLAAPAMLGDAAVTTLRGLVGEGQRLRVQLAALQALFRQGQPSEASETARRGLALAGRALELAADVIAGDTAAAQELQNAVSALTQLAAEQQDQTALSRRLAGLAGQIRAVGSLAPAAGEGGGLRSRRPHRRTSRPLERLRSDLAQIRANANLSSPAGRHALRLAVVVPLAELLSRQLPLERGYWMVVAAATVLRPEFSATFTRGAERALGTCLGVALAGAIAVGLHPSGGVTVVLVGLLAWAGYSVFPASFAIGFAFITALVVFLLNAISPDTLATASARLLDTLVGGSLGLLAYAVWPTWAQGTAREALAGLLDADRAYLAAVLDALRDGRALDEHELRAPSRRARMARTSAEDAVGRSLSEPETRRIDPEQSRGALGAMRRLIQATHILRLDAEEDQSRAPRPALGPLAAQIDRLLAVVEAELAGNPVPAPALPDLRQAFDGFARAHDDDPGEAELLAELDEIVDAANSLAAVVGLETFAPASA